MPSPDLEEACIVIIVKGVAEVESRDGDRWLMSLASQFLCRIWYILLFSTMFHLTDLSEK
jgi:hypothetical protein